MTETSDYKVTVHYLNDIFTAQECDDIISIGMGYPLELGQITSSGVQPDLRRCKTRFFEWNELDWAQERCFKTIMDMNCLMKYDVTDFEERFKFMRYDAGDHYRLYHLDTGRGYQSRRKISIIVQLSEQDKDYEGGNIIFNPYQKECITCGKDEPAHKGSVIVFPSFLQHCVEPITKGTRFSYTNWISGPPLK